MRKNLLRHVVFLFSVLSAAAFCAAATETPKQPAKAQPKRLEPARPVSKPATQIPQIPATKDYMQVKFTPTYLMTGHPNQYYISSDLQNWQTKAYPDTIKPFNPMGIAVVGPSFFLMVGRNGMVVVSKNACLSLQLYSVGEDVTLSDVCYLAKSATNPTGKFIAVGFKDGSGMIYVSADEGQTWTKVKTVTGALNTVAGNDKGQVVTVGNGGFLYSNDAGQTWQDAQWGSEHIPMTENLGQIFKVIWDPFTASGRPSRFVFVMYGKRDDVRCINFRYSSDGASWQTGHEDLSALDGTRRSSVENESTIQSRKVVSNGKGQLITHPQMWPGTYYSSDGGNTWLLFYYNIDPAWKSMVDVTCDGQQFVGLAYEPAANGDRYVCTSGDGQTWTPITVAKEFSQSANRIFVGFMKK